MEAISTRQVAARIRCGTLPQFDRGEPRCALHPHEPTGTQTENLKFWSKGDRIWCPKCNSWTPALPVFAALNIAIDTRL